jgi:hypothetical protein
MNGIHDAILDKLQSELQVALIDSLAVDDPARAGVIMQGPLQGNPDPDEARISVTLFENDPDQLAGGGLGSNGERWDDRIVESEVGGLLTWARRFTIKARCLLANTQEDLTAARHIASTLRSRIEKTLLTMRFSDVRADDGEYVSFGVDPENIHGSTVQSGGPPDAYDFHIKIRFEVFTTTTGGLGS